MIYDDYERFPSPLRPYDSAIDAPRYAESTFAAISAHEDNLPRMTDDETTWMQTAEDTATWTDKLNDIYNRGGQELLFAEKFRAPGGYDWDRFTRGN
jgi:hypothetical protein